MENYGLLVIEELPCRLLFCNRLLGKKFMILCKGLGGSYPYILCKYGVLNRLHTEVVAEEFAGRKFFQPGQKVLVFVGICASNTNA